jgi:hypothetical protein
MRGLKVLVIFMGVAILVGFAVVIFTIATRLGDGAVSEGGFGVAAVALPQGCLVAEMVPADERVLLRLEGPEERGCNAILVVDLETGATLGELRLGAVPATDGAE